MSFNRSTRVPRSPTLPKGEQVASYGTYLEAQHAVDHLADKQFPVQLVTIVGTDLRMVERVTGRLSYPRVALAGFASGAWFGLFVGILLSMFSSTGSTPTLFAAILIGGAFGLLFSVITYSFTGGKRDFTSTSQIVATQYALLRAGEQAHKARNLLREVGGVTSGWPAAPPLPASAPSDPTATYPVPGAPSAPPAAPTTPSHGQPFVDAPPTQPPAPPGS